MPCNTIKTVGVKVSKMDLDTLRTALATLGYYVTRSGTTLVWGRESYNQLTGELQVTSQAQAQKIIRAYGKQGVRQIAQKFVCQFVQNPLDQNKFTLLKHSV